MYKTYSIYREGSIGSTSVAPNGKAPGSTPPARCVATPLTSFLPLPFSHPPCPSLGSHTHIHHKPHTFALPLYCWPFFAAPQSQPPQLHRTFPGGPSRIGPRPDHCCVHIPGLFLRRHQPHSPKRAAQRSYQGASRQQRAPSPLFCTPPCFHGLHLEPPAPSLG